MIIPTLVPLTRMNTKELLALETSEAHLFVATPEESIMESLRYPKEFFCIYLSQTLIGLLRFGFNQNLKMLFIYRLMIAEPYRNKGYGTQITTELLKQHKNKKIGITVHPDNTHAIHIYTKIGFVPTNITIDGENLLVTPDTPTQQSQTHA